MTYLVEMPLDGGGRVIVQVDEADLPAGVELAGAGKVVARARDTLEASLDQLRPVVNAVRDRLSALAPEETSVEFGVLLGGEAGIVLAKGTTQVHLTVTLTWKGARPGDG